MRDLNILNAHEVEIILKIRDGEILHVDLASLYFIHKFGNDERELMRVTIPESTNEDGTTNPQIRYGISIHHLHEHTADCFATVGGQKICEFN